jgi:hypothetical protein
MKEKELQKLKIILKPLIKECIKEAIFEEGVLSTLVAEIVTGMGQPIVEQKKEVAPSISPNRNKEKISKRLQESKNKMLDAIGRESYHGVNLFEGTEPLSSGGSEGTPSASPMSGISPDDKGVSIDGLMNAFGNKWNALK